MDLQGLHPLVQIAFHDTCIFGSLVMLARLHLNSLQTRLETGLQLSQYREDTLQQDKPEQHRCRVQAEYPSSNTCPIRWSPPLEKPTLKVDRKQVFSTDSLSTCEKVNQSQVHIRESGVMAMETLQLILLHTSVLASLSCL